MSRRMQDDSRIVSVRLPEELIRRLDRSLDWSETTQQGKASRNAAMREALSSWLDEQEQLTGLVSPATLRRQFRAAYDRVSPGQDWVPIPRLRRQLQWPSERFDAVLEGRRAARHVELKSLEPGAMSDTDIQDSSAVHRHLYGALRWGD